jgi:hypothetical protein
MKRLLIALAVTAVGAIANATMPRTAAANPDPTGSWQDVCCGESCGYKDYCLGDGNKTCCKV